MHSTIQMYDDGEAAIVVMGEDPDAPIVEVRQPSRANSATLIFPIPVWRSLVETLTEAGIIDTPKEH